MKILYRLKSKKGFTLVEMMISFLLLIIIIDISAGIIIMSGNIFARNAVLNDTQIIATEVSKMISDKLSVADSVKISRYGPSAPGNDPPSASDPASGDPTGDPASGDPTGDPSATPSTPSTPPEPKYTEALYFGMNGISVRHDNYSLKTVNEMYGADDLGTRKIIVSFDGSHWTADRYIEYTVSVYDGEITAESKPVYSVTRPLFFLNYSKVSGADGNNFSSSAMDNTSDELWLIYTYIE